MLEKEAEGENADVSKDSQQKGPFTVLNPSMVYGACLPPYGCCKHLRNKLCSPSGPWSAPRR